MVFNLWLKETVIITTSLFDTSYKKPQRSLLGLCSVSSCTKIKCTSTKYMFHRNNVYQSRVTSKPASAKRAYKMHIQKYSRKKINIKLQSCYILKMQSPCSVHKMPNTNWIFNKIGLLNLNDWSGSSVLQFTISVNYID